MATVSELGWYSIGRVDFCACCGLRRELGKINVEIGEDQETVRCIDCFFGPEHSEFSGFVFRGTAVFIGASDRVCKGQTGDVLGEAYPSMALWFEPHGEQTGLNPTRIAIAETELTNFSKFNPKRYTERSYLYDEP